MKEMKRKLLVTTLLMLAFCMLTPTVLAQAETIHSTDKVVEVETFTDTGDLPQDYFYSQVKVTATITSEYYLVYTLVEDANGNMHVKVKSLIKDSIQIEAWFWDEALQDWVFGQSGSQTSRRITAENVLIVNSEGNSEVQTGRALMVVGEKFEVAGINPETGETFTLENMLIRHLMFKVVNGELQFENSWQINKGDTGENT